MTRRSRKRRSNSLGGTLLLVVILALAGISAKLSVDDLRLVAISGLLIACLTTAAVVFFSLWRKQRGRRRLQALRIVDLYYMDGFAFEKYVAELMKHQGYTGVTLTEKYDYGIDIIATKHGIRWGVQVKRHRKPVKAEAVRAAVTALTKYKCQRAMVVTNSTFTGAARVLAESNNCVLIGRNEIADWIIAFQGA